MARRYQSPLCKAEIFNGKEWRPCRVEMRPLGERHPDYQPGHWVFQCPRCNALRSLSSGTLDRYVRPL